MSLTQSKEKVKGYLCGVSFIVREMLGYRNGMCTLKIRLISTDNCDLNHLNSFSKVK